MIDHRDLHHTNCPTCLRARAQVLIARAERIEHRRAGRTTMDDFDHALDEYDKTRSVWLKIPQDVYNRRRAAGEADEDFPEHVAYRLARENLKVVARCLGDQEMP